MTKPPVLRRPMTPQEIEMAKALGHCSFQPATGAKNFAAKISGRAYATDPQISENEARYLRDCVFTFRKQIKHTVVAYAGDVIAERKARKAGVQASLADYERAKLRADADRAAARVQAKAPSEELDLFAGGAP